MAESQNVISLIIKAVDQATSEINQVQGTVNKLGNLIATGLGVTSVIMLVRKLQGEFEKVFDAVETVRLSTAGLASMITSFASKPGEDLSLLYRQSYDYSQLLVQKMEEWDSKTLTTGQELLAINETLLQGGILLDVNNKKQEEGFLAIANTVKILTAQYPNAAAQIRSEVRALIEGVVRPGDQLARLLDQKIGGKLKEHIELWKQEGKTVERVGEQLAGFTEGSKDIANTWTAVSSTLETIGNKFLRTIFEPVYNDILSIAKSFTAELSGQIGLHQEATKELEKQKGIQEEQEGIQKKTKDVVKAQKTGADSVRNDLYAIWEITKNILGALKDLVVWIAKPVISILEWINGVEKLLRMLGALSVLVRYLAQTAADTFAWVSEQFTVIWDQAKVSFNLMKEALTNLLDTTEHFLKAGYNVITFQFKKGAEEFEKAREALTKEIPIPGSGQMPFERNEEGTDAWRKAHGRKTLKQMILEYEKGFWAPPASTTTIPPKLGSGPSADELEKQAKATAKLAEAQGEYVEELGKSRIGLLQSDQAKEKAILEEKYKTGLVAAEGYYARLAEMAKTLTQNEIVELDKQKEAAQKTYESDLKAAETPKEKDTVSENYKTQTIKLDAEIAGKKAALDLQIIQLTQKRNEELRSMAQKQAEAEMKFQEQAGENKISALRTGQEDERAILEQSYKDRLISAKEYYAEQIRMAEEFTRAEISGLETKKSALKNASDIRKSSASTLERQIIERETATEIAGIDNEIFQKRENLRLETLRLERASTDEIKSFTRERVTAKVSLLVELLQKERISTADRIMLGEEYRQTRISQIQQESEELRKQGVAEETITRIVKERKKEIENDVRLYT